MGPVNWLAVVLAALFATLLALLWHARLLRSDSRLVPGTGARPAAPLAMLVVMALAAIMLGHNFARIGEATLSAKPWLYFMMSGGLAAFFVIPAVAVSQARERVEPMRYWLDAAFWLVAYLAMGLVFWALG